MKLARSFLLLACAFSAMPVFKIGPLWFADLFFIFALLFIVLSDAGRLFRLPLAIVVASTLAGISVAISAIPAVNSAESVLVGAKIIYVWLAISAVLVATGGSKDFYLASLLQWFALGAAISSVAAMGQAGLGIEIPGTSTVLNRMSGLTGHANAQGGILGIALAIVSGFLLVGTRKTLNMLLLGLITVGLVLCASVSGMLAGLSGIAISFVVLKRRTRSALFFALFGLVAWLANEFYTATVPAAKTPWDRFLDTTGKGEGISTVEQRQLSWEAAWRGIQSQPIIGHGMDAQSGLTDEGTLAHNILILCWYQGGLLLLLAVLLVIFSAGKSVLSASTHQRQSIEAILAIGAFTAAVVGAMTGPQLYDRWFWLPILLALIISHGPGIHTKKSKIKRHSLDHNFTPTP